MCPNKFRIFYLIFFVEFFLLALKVQECNALVKFKSLDCYAKSDDYLKLESCHIKIISRNRGEVQVEGVVQKKLTNVEVRTRVMKKYNGWRPFPVNFNVKLCDFFRNPRRYIIANIAFQYVKNYTNIVHKCPYLPGEKITMKYPEPADDTVASLLKLFPVDPGEYGVFVDIYVDNVLEGSINGSASYIDYKKWN